MPAATTANTAAIVSSTKAIGDEPSETPKTNGPRRAAAASATTPTTKRAAELAEQDAREAAGRDQETRERAPVALVVHAHRGAEHDREQHEHEREARHALLEDGDREAIAGEVLLA